MFEAIPNNVNLSDDKRLQRALLQWQPNFLKWWMEVGPEGFQEDRIWLRTAIGVNEGGWAHWDYVKMPNYRWGIFLGKPRKEDAIYFGDRIGQPLWDQVPGEHRKELRRLIVTQGDTEPASVEQQRLLGKVAPSLLDLRNLFQVNVEEARHLWAMVYLLHTYFGSNGREEAEEMLERRSGHRDHPRILEAFNKPIRDWLALYCFTMFTDRDGKYQLCALAESAFDPLARTTRFMLQEEAFHMSVGDQGIGRVVRRTAELMKAGTDPKSVGAIPLEVVQRYINEWCSASHDLFGGEDSSNAALYFAAGLKGRFKEAEGYGDHRALDAAYQAQVLENGRLATKEIPLRRAMNAVLLDSYAEDCQNGLRRWNKILEEIGLSERLYLPQTRFNRHVGIHAGLIYDPNGNPMDPAEYAKQKAGWLPTQADYDLVQQSMIQVLEPGKMAGWIAPPDKGVGGKPVDYEYVLFH